MPLTHDDPGFPAPPQDVDAFDKPNDAGNMIVITWKKSPDDGAGKNNVTGYYLYRAETIDGTYEKVQKQLFDPGDGSFQDRHSIKIDENKVILGKPYYYKVSAVTKDGLESFSSDSKDIDTWGLPS